jgi:hypothetical protein
MRTIHLLALALAVAGCDALDEPAADELADDDRAPRDVMAGVFQTWYQLEPGQADGRTEEVTFARGAAHDTYAWTRQACAAGAATCALATETGTFEIFRTTYRYRGSDGLFGIQLLKAHQYFARLTDDAGRPRGIYELMPLLDTELWLVPMPEDARYDTKRRLGGGPRIELSGEADVAGGGERCDVLPCNVWTMCDAEQVCVRDPDAP